MTIAAIERNPFIDIRSGRERVVLRPARPEDMPSRCDLFARVGMESELVLGVDRAPDFDALYRLQTRDWISWVVEIDGIVEGMGVVLARDCWLGGERTRVGYLGDLRFSPRARGRRLIDRYYGPVLRDATERLGCELFLTSVITSNQSAIHALVPRQHRAPIEGRPNHTPLRDFAIRSIHLLFPRRRRRSDVRVRRAVPSDITAIAKLLDEDARRRAFGYVLSEVELRRRLADWPGLSVDSFLLAEAENGTLLGCIAPWDSAPIKRMVVREYRGRMRHVRFGHDIAAHAFGRPPLPTPGGELRYQYLTHQAVPSDNPIVLRALLEAAYASARALGYHCLSVCALRGDRLDGAYRGFLSTDLAARLYLVNAPDTPVPESVFARSFPGFEMALV